MTVGTSDIGAIRSTISEELKRKFERHVLPLSGDLRGRARSYTNNDADADDLVQDTLLKAFKAFDELRDESHLWGWLVCIMRNTWISNHRATQRRPAEVLNGEIAEGRLDTWAALPRQPARSPPNIMRCAT